jgi:hypothetical protein
MINPREKLPSAIPGCDHPEERTDSRIQQAVYKVGQDIIVWSDSDYSPECRIGILH